MPMPSEADPTIIPDSTCLACGCLCDDIAVAVAGGRVVGAERACRVGLPWFLAPHPGEGHPGALVGGNPAGLDEALDRAAAILREARAPLVWGLTGAATEAAGAALGIADRVGAAVDLAGSAGRAAHRAAFVRSGAVSSTLGEVRDRAGVVLFWGGHPDATHPRHGERYSIRPAGRFVAGPRSVLVVDAGAGPTAGAADVRVALDPGRQGEALGVLLALADDVPLDGARVERATGHPPATWADLVGRFRAAPHGAVFFGPAAGGLDATGWDRAARLVRALNRDGRRCVGLDLGGPGNGAGAEAALTWQAGAPGWLDFGGGAPRHLPGDADLPGRLDRGEVDAVLAVGAGAERGLSARGLARLGAIPWVEVAPGATRARPSGPAPTVAIDAGRLGIEAGGTVARVDGVMLPLRPALLGARPAELTALRGIAARLAGPP